MSDPRALPDMRQRWLSPERPFRATRRRPPGRPNIIFVLADDLGWGDLGCFGSLHNATPNIDHLAAGGLRLTNAYAASATCSPTRIGLYTGRYPGRLAAGLEEPLTTRDEHHGIPAGHPTLASLLKDAGYHTAMFGKWHCGWLPWFSPLRAGFEEFFGNLDGALDYFSHIDTAGHPDIYEGEVPVEKVGYYTEILSERAAEYVRSASRGEPFYLQVNYTAPHWPWEGPGDTATSARVTEAQRSRGLSALFHFEGGSLSTYRAMVAALDDGVGQVLAALEETGRADDTVVVFSSDNGGERYAFLWPFLGKKGDLEEGGIRVPFALRWPAALDGGQVDHFPNVTMDWTATLLELAGAPAAPGYPLDGVSLLPWLVDGAPPPERDLLWRTREQGALRRGRWKLLYDRQAKPLWHGRFAKAGPRVRLFDLSVDGRETADLAGEHPERVAQMLGSWEAFDHSLLAYPPPGRPRPAPLEGVAD